jgi:hypothetical protein
VEELKRSMLNLSETKTQLETKVCVYANPIKTIIKTRRTMKKSPLKFIRMCAWLDHDTDWSVDEEDDRQSDIEKKPVPRRRARRIKLNWGPDGDKGENDAEGAHGPIITTFSGNGRSC